MIKNLDFLGSRYLYLLITLVAYFLLGSLFSADHYANIVLGFIFLLIFIFCFKIAISDQRALYTVAVLGLLALSGNVYLDLIGLNYFVILSHFIIIVIFMSLITASVIYSVTKHSSITADTLLGAICGYLLIGFTWTFIYLTIDTLNASAFSDHIQYFSFDHKVQSYIYYSFVTLTTTGYGDIYANSAAARSWSWVEAVVGQIYLAVWISQLVSLHIIQKLRN
jgi:voltage-gated potassium channel